MGYLDGMQLSGLDGLESPAATDQAAVDSTQTGKGNTKRWTPPDRTPAERADILKVANDRWKYAVDNVDADNRREALIDYKFAFIPGHQWDEEVKQNERRDRLNLEINQLPQFINNVVNDMRQNRAGIMVLPDDDASEEEAKLRQGVIRGIEYESQADTIYDAGGRDAVAAGRGYWRVLSEYESETSFRQRLSIKPCPDFNSVVLDPDYQQPDGSDRQWGFVVEKMTKAAFEKAYPKAQPLDWSDTSKLWTDAQNNVLVADYYTRTAKKRTLVALSTGEVFFEDEPPASISPGATKVDEREVDSFGVEWFKLAGGQQILAEFFWPGKTIPIVCCIGNDFMVEGKRYFMGLTRWARDPVKAYNFATSAMWETVALTPKQPYIMAEGQDEGHEDEWAQANRRNFPYLTYRPKTIGNQLAPPPQRAQGAMVPPGYAELTAQARGDMRATIGIYDPSLGQKSNETSGRAILAREKQGDVATFNFPDNQARAIALTGRIINECLPTYYDGMREVRTVGPDGKPSTEPTVLNGPSNMNRLNPNARFVLRVDVGPGYQTRKQEARESMAQFLQAVPQAGPFLGDLLAKAQDWEGHEEVAKRLRLMLPPPIAQALAAEEQGGGDPAAAMQQMQQQLQEAQQQAQQMQAEMQKLQQRNQELESGAAVQGQKVEADKATAMAKAAADAQAREVEAQAELELETRIARMRLDNERTIALERARIEAETKITVAQIEAEARATIEAMKPAPIVAAPQPGAGAV